MKKNREDEIEFSLPPLLTFHPRAIHVPFAPFRYHPSPRIESAINLLVLPWTQKSARSEYSFDSLATPSSPESTVNASTAGQGGDGLKERQLRSAEADVFIRRRICIRCSRSPIARSSAVRRGSKIQRSFVPLYPARTSLLPLLLHPSLSVLPSARFLLVTLSPGRAPCQLSFSGWNSGPRAIFLVAPRFAAPRRFLSALPLPPLPGQKRWGARPPQPQPFPWLALTYEAIAFRRSSSTISAIVGPFLLSSYFCASIRPTFIWFSLVENFSRGLYLEKYNYFIGRQCPYSWLKKKKV